MEQNSSVPFHFELHPAFLEEADFEILKSAPVGLFHFEVGIQSTNVNVLKAVNRPFNWDKEKENIQKLCNLKNIHAHLDQIVALPGDNRETAIHSFNDIISLRPDEFQLGFLKVLPGTKLAQNIAVYNMAVKRGPPDEVISTETMDFQTLTEFYLIERTLNRFYNSHYFKKTLSFLLDHAEDPWQFFTDLSKLAPADQTIKRWPVLGETLLKYAQKFFPGDKGYITDLLRLDWCPYASAQNYPPFLRIDDGETIKISRRKAFDYFSEHHPGFTRRGFNHSILFIPKTNRLKAELSCEGILFYKENRVLELTLHHKKI